MTANTVTETAVSREVAEHMTEAIRKAGATLATARTKFAAAIKEAKEGNAHVVLGFKAWPEYVAHTLSAESLPKLAQADREWLIGFMAGEGMSSRAIARAFNVSQSTANRAIKAQVSEGNVKAEREVVGNDGIKQGAKKATSAKAPKPGESKVTHPAVKAAKAYAAAVKRLTESGDFDLAALDPETASEVQGILNGTRSDMVRVVKALDAGAKVKAVKAA